MKSLYIKDVKMRKNLKRKELFNIWCKSSFLNSGYNFETKEKIVYFFFSRTKNEYLSKIKNRCFFSNRSRSVLSFFGLSRIKIREFASFGLLNGTKKSSW